MLKMPKNVLASPLAPKVEALFSEAPLRPGGAVKVSHWRWHPTLAAALVQAVRSEQVLRGLETIAATLDRELKGLRAVQAKAETPAQARLSRLLLLTNDGSGRFYHDAESLLLRHGERAWGCVLSASSQDLGKALHGSAAKAVMIGDRKVLEAFLLALAKG